MHRTEPTAQANPRMGIDGAANGRRTSSLGINPNFGPVLDVASNPQNPVIGARSFSQEPEVVATRACTFREQMEAMAYGVR
jgi:beta-N-acetylhexosaminidase